MLSQHRESNPIGWTGVYSFKRIYCAFKQSQFLEDHGQKRRHVRLSFNISSFACRNCTRCLGTVCVTFYSTQCKCEKPHAFGAATPEVQEDCQLEEANPYTTTCISRPTDSVGMKGHKDLVRWAEEIGVLLDGVGPAHFPGRGSGMVAHRPLQVSTPGTNPIYALPYPF